MPLRVLNGQRLSPGPGDDDAVVVLQVGGDFGRPAPLQIGRGGTDHALQVGNLALDEWPFRDMAGAHGDVGLLLDEVDQPVGDRQIDVDVRIARQKIGQRRRELMQAEGGAGVDPQPAARAHRAPA